MGQRELAGPAWIGSTGMGGTAFLNLSGFRCQGNGLEELTAESKLLGLRLGGAGSSHQLEGGTGKEWEGPGQA